MRNLSLLSLACSLLVWSVSAAAQAPPSAPASPPAQSAPAPDKAGRGCAPTDANPDHGSLSPRAGPNDPVGRPLTDKLARSDGVLCPPGDVDPQIRAPTPDVGKTPVILPPGGPGGDPAVRPK